MKHSSLLVSFLVSVALGAAPLSVVAQETVDLSITVTSPVQGSIPAGAQRVEFLHLVATASCERDARVQEITVHHRGLGSLEDIEGLSVWIGDRRVSRSIAPARPSGSAVLRPRLIVVPKCQSVEISIRGDFSPEASPAAEHVFSLSQDDVRTDGDVSVVTGAKAPASLTVIPAENSEISVSMISVSTPVSFGPQRIVARMAVESTGNRDQKLISIMLTNDGSATGMDLQNLVLLNTRRERISSVLPSLSGDTATFVLNPSLVLQSGDERVLSVAADVRASRRRTIRFLVEEPSDVQAVVCTRGCSL